MSLKSINYEWDIHFLLTCLLSIHLAYFRHFYFHSLMCIYPDLLPLALFNTRSIFKESKFCLNPEFSFFLTSCLTKDKKLNLPNYLPIARSIKDGLIAFLRELSIKAQSFGLWPPIAFSTRNLMLSVLVVFDDVPWKHSITCQPDLSYFKYCQRSYPWE